MAKEMVRCPAECSATEAMGNRVPGRREWSVVSHAKPEQHLMTLPRAASGELRGTEARL